MAENVQWIKLKVGMFDGNSFKKIKRAKIGGVSYRDKLTSVWFELMDLAGKSNSNGYLIDNNEIPYHSFEDIATMLDREEKEIELCMQFFINEKMVEIIDDIYCLTNFVKYQNQEGLDKIREQKRLAQSRWRERKKLGLIENDVDKKTSTETSTNNLPSISISNSISISKDNIEDKNKENKSGIPDVNQRKTNLDNTEAQQKYVEGFNYSEDLKNSIKIWLSYKKEKKQVYKPTGFNTLISKINKDIEEFGEQYVIDSIENSIVNNYSGIFAPKNYNNHNYSPSQAKENKECTANKVNGVWKI